MELKNIILSEVTQTQKDIRVMCSLTCLYQPKSTEDLGYNLQTIRSVTSRNAHVRGFHPHLGGEGNNHRRQREEGTWVEEGSGRGKGKQDQVWGRDRREAQQLGIRWEGRLFRKYQRPWR